MLKENNKENKKIDIDIEYLIRKNLDKYPIFVNEIILK